MNTTRIIQWNCRGIKPNLEELLLLINNYEPVTICLQETKLHAHGNLNINTYTSYLKNVTADTAHGGVAVLVHKDIPQKQIQLVTNLQAVAARVSLFKCITICSIYLPPDQPIIESELNDLLMQLPTPILLIGDYNSHSPLWGCSYLDNKGHQIEDFLNKNTLCILNEKQTTYIHPATGTKTSIDLAITTPSIMSDLSWYVHDDLCGSDHFPIILQNSKPGPSERIPNWKLNKADWTLFSRLCSSSLATTTVSCVEVNPIEQFTKNLISIAESTIPKTSAFPKRQPKPWFNEECRAAIKERRKSLNNFKKVPTQDNLSNFRRIRAKARQIIKASKKHCWKQYVSKLNESTTSCRVWDMVRKINNNGSRYSVNHLLINQEEITDRKKISDAIGLALTKNSSDIFYDTEFLNYKHKSERQPISFNSDNLEYYNTSITLFELKQAVHCCHDSSPGPDTVHYQFLKRLPPESLELLLKLFNDVFNGKCPFPASWREAIIIPIPKPNKDHTDPNNYRPIALTSCICKVFERIINNRLIYYLESNDLLAKTQSGFRRGHSTTDHLVRLETWIREGIANKEHVVSVFYDLEKAYDTTWKYGILKDLHTVGLRGNLPNFIQNFLKDRSFKVRIGSTYSSTFPQTNGVPQGSILSVTLFGLKINSITKCVVSGVDNCLFVDDFLTCCRSKNMRTIERKLQLTLNNLSKWSNENGFKFSNHKTVCVHFCNQRKAHLDPYLTLNNSQIPVVKETKFLGVVFDSKLSFIPNLKQLKSKCQKSLNLLKIVAHKTWGGDATTMLKLYKSLILSKLDYGSIVYNSSRNSYLRMLDPIQTQALRLCLGAFRTSPVESLHAEMGVLPLRLRRMKLSFQYYLKAISNKSLPVTQVFIANLHKNIFDKRTNLVAPFGIRMERLCEAMNLNIKTILDEETMPLPPWCIKTPEVNLDLHKTTKSCQAAEYYKAIFCDFINSKVDYTNVYTDGSKDDSGVGAAAVCGTSVITIRLPHEASIYTAEAKAILIALDIIAISDKNKFLILSDSLSCLASILSCNYTNPLIKEILLKLNTRLVTKVVEFCWIPSHVGITGNEQADNAAKRATCQTIDTSIKVPHTDLKQKINSYLWKLRQTEWDNITYNKLKAIKPTINTATKLCNLKNRHEESVMYRIRIGHTFLTHGYLIKREAPPECNFCQVTQTVEHILLHCPLYNACRSSQFTCTNLPELLDGKHNLNIIDFLKEIKIFDQL